jgi:hypothetical protein
MIELRLGLWRIYFSDDTLLWSSPDAPAVAEALNGTMRWSEMGGEHEGPVEYARRRATKLLPDARVVRVDAGRSQRGIVY